MVYELIWSKTKFTTYRALAFSLSCAMEILRIETKEHKISSQQEEVK